MPPLPDGHVEPSIRSADAGLHHFRLCSAIIAGLALLLIRRDEALVLYSSTSATRRDLSSLFCVTRSFGGAGPGKRIAGLRVVQSKDGKTPLTYGQGIVRWLSQLIPIFNLFDAIGAPIKIPCSAATATAGPERECSTPSVSSPRTGTRSRSE